MTHYNFDCGCSFPIASDAVTIDGVPQLHFDIEKVPLDCKAVWELLSKGFNCGVFQLESGLGQRWIRELQVDSLKDVIALSALLRPGSLLSYDDKGVSMTQHYALRKLGKEEAVPIHPAIEDLLRDTYQVCIYQEQAMKIVAKLANFNKQEQDYYRKCVAGTTKLVSRRRGSVSIHSLLELDDWRDDEFLSMDSSQNLIWVKLNDLWFSGSKETTIIQTKNSYLECTPDHKILTLHGWKEAQWLTSNDYIVSLNYEGKPEATRFHRRFTDDTAHVFDFTVDHSEIHWLFGNNLLIHNSAGKKDASEMSKVETLFLNRVEDVGLVSKKEGQYIFDTLKAAQRYSFNECNSSDTKLLWQGRSLKYTIEQMYKIRNDISYAKSLGALDTYKKWKRLGNYGRALSLGDDGRIRPNTIENIKFAGHRDIYEITLDNGATIKVTDNHKFPTGSGEKMVSELTENDSLYICGEYEKGNGKKYNWSNVTKKERKGRPSKTNGAYTKWKINKEKLPEHCQKCGIIQKRMEIHHIDGDRSNNELSNLEKLCASCHKKIEYANGRTVKGEKGYPSHLVKIKSITYVGKDNVYNITMSGPNHNFVVESGIVSCNSHSASYGLRGYQTAYIKAHFPVTFFLTWLKFAKYRNRQDKDESSVAELLSEAKLLNVNVSLPRLDHLKDDFYFRDGSIHFGLTNIRDIGFSNFEKIAELSKNVNLCDYYEVLAGVLFNIGASTTNLIDSGSLDYLEGSRTSKKFDVARLNAVFKTGPEREWFNDNWRNYKNLLEVFDDLENKKDEVYKSTTRYNDAIDAVTQWKNPGAVSLEDDKLALIDKELHTLKVSISHGTDEISIPGQVSCKDLFDKIADSGRIVVVPTEFFKFLRKNGKNAGLPMAKVRAGDNSGELDFLMFQSSDSEKAKEFTDNWDKLRKNVPVVVDCHRWNDTFVINKISSI